MPIALPQIFAAWIALISAPAYAQEAVSLQIRKDGQIGTSNPALIVLANQALNRLDVQVSCGGVKQEFHEAISSKREIPLEFAVPVGNHQCKGTLSIVDVDGGTGEMPINFSISMLAKLKMTIDTDTVSVANKQLTVSMDRPASEYDITIIDSNNSEVGGSRTSVPSNSSTKPQTITWKTTSDDIAVIKVRGKDTYGFFTETLLFPWHYDIPHEDVIFSSNQATINSSEVPKLQAVQTEVQKVVEKYSQFAVVNLYVAGYTDTVGDAQHNLELSEKRAKSIAEWFTQNGFTGDIYYQGFGESALAVPTGDGVDQAANRRALYVVAATTPQTSSDFPKKNWKKLQ